MRPIAIGMLVFHLGVARFADAQTFQHLTIDMEGRTIGLNGGEQPNTGMSSGPVVIGKTTSAGFAKTSDMCGFAVAPRLQPGAVSGWNVDVTPTAVEGDAVTFRVRWLRSRDENRDSSSPGGTLDLTLRPGESLPLDLVPLSPSVTMPYERCKVRATSLHVAVNYWPRAQDDRRLVVTDLWLIDRQQDGTERSQALSLRGLFNQATPFHFDTVTDGAVSLELFGEFMVAPGSGSLAMTLKTRSRLTENGTSSTTVRYGALVRARQVDSVIQLKPGEVVAVALPRLSESDGGAFATRTFSLRVQSRQVR